MICRGEVLRVLQLGQPAVLDVDIVVVLTAQDLRLEQSFQSPEALPQGKLILAVAFKGGGKAAAGEAFESQLRLLGQLPPLREGLGPGAVEPAGQGQGQEQGGKEKEKAVFGRFHKDS